MTYKIKIQSETDWNLEKKMKENKVSKYYKRKNYLSEQEAIVLAAKENKIVAYV